ncbi:unnamed protein product [Rhizoctonia solani]|uniref:Uncharacterized protein n=1 Tax=Rhizoctonia solani TaxID=456999 RepID=A0A8H2WC26_9AGAM|nr:unnamed protein product [Rhizoctonia solani]
MGKVISTLLTGTSADAQVKEQLQFLVNSATERLNRYQLELENGFADKTEISRHSIPGNRALRWPSEAVSGAVDSFFEAAGGKGGAKDNVVSGFKHVVTGALNAFLGNARAGEHEEQKFFVFMQHNAIIRLDVKLWRYNFSSDGIIAQQQNVLCYIICSSVVDRSVLTFDELIYLISEHAGDDDVEAYIDSLAKIWRKMEDLPLRTLPGYRDGAPVTKPVEDTPKKEAPKSDGK